MSTCADVRDGRGDAPADRVCVGEIGAAHGLRGEVFVRSFTADPVALADYGPLLAEPGGRRLRLRVVGEKKAALIVRVDGVADRDAAEALRGLRLFVDRAALPEPDEDEFYHADLIGLTAEFAVEDAATPEPPGRIGAVHDFGAGSILEIVREGEPPVLVPFTRAAVPVVDLPGRRVVVAPLPGLLAAGSGETAIAEDEPAAPAPTEGIVSVGQGSS